MNATVPLLTIIIVNWNGGQFILDCLASVIAKTPQLPYEIIVVDNASGDGSPAQIRANFPQSQLLETTANLGYAAGNNRALDLARGRYVALLNPDTLLETAALEQLVAFLEDHPNVGAVGPALLHPHNRYAIRNGGWQPTLGTVAAHYSFLSRLWPARFRGLHLTTDTQQRVGWLSGACLVVRRAIIADVGPLLAEWFLYAEDVEWCDRIAAAGWELWYLPTARIIHRDRQSVGQHDALATHWIHAIRQHYRRRAQPTRWQRQLFDAILVVGLLSRALGYAARALRAPTDATWRTEARSFTRAAWEIASGRPLNRPAHPPA